MTTQPIVDSNYTKHEVLTQNPDFLAPDEIMHSVGLMDVQYISFDNRLHLGQIVVALEVMADVEAFFRHSVEQNFPIAKVIPASHPDYAWNDEKLMAGNVSSGFNYRTIADTDKPSMHARGLAFDINPVQNPYIRYEGGKKIVKPYGARWNKGKPGTLHAEHPLVKLMEGFGWEWGGHWLPESGRTDYQHFQKA